MLTRELPATYVKRRRTPGWRKPEGAISCTRGKHPNSWANPFRPGDVVDGRQVETHDEAVELYRRWLRDRPDVQVLAVRELAGKTLMCWCAPGQTCHVQDVLLPLVNEGLLP